MILPATATAFRAPIKAAFLPLLFAVLIAATPASAQYVKSFPLDAELKRLVQVCVKYAELGKVEMPDQTRYGYKVSKLSYGTVHEAAVSLNGKKVDVTKLAKGTGMGTSLRWMPARGHDCTVVINLRMEKDLKLGNATKQKVEKVIKSMGYARKTGKDSRGRAVQSFDKGPNSLRLTAGVKYYGRTRDSSSLVFEITNTNNAARKN